MQSLELVAVAVAVVKGLGSVADDLRQSDPDLPPARVSCWNGLFLAHSSCLGVVQVKVTSRRQIWVSHNHSVTGMMSNL